MTVLIGSLDSAVLQLILTKYCKNLLCVNREKIAVSLLNVTRKNAANSFLIVKIAIF